MSNPVTRWPQQIKYIIGNEACERFSYYGMRSILAGYITGAVLQGGLGQSADRSTEIIHTFVSVNYFMPLLGAWLSDKLIGRYHTILWVSLFYCAGHGVLACSDFVGGVDGKLWCLFAGLALIAFGSGGIKPCVSAFMGDQFAPEQSHLLQKAYGAFYWSINLGSFFSFLVIPWIKNHHGYSWAFGVPGIFMAVATFVFWLGTKHYVRVPPSGDRNWWKKVIVAFHLLLTFWSWLQLRHAFPNKPCFLLLIANSVPYLTWAWNSNTAWLRRLRERTEIIEAGFFAVSWFTLLKQFARKPGQSFWGVAHDYFTDKSIFNTISLWRILMIFALVPPFWSLFDQTNSTWVLQGGKMKSFDLFGLQIGAEQMQSANPLLVMILVPILTLLIYPRLGKLASPLKRMSYGMFLGAFSYVIVAALQQRIEAGAQLSVAWQTLPYIVLTAAEVLVSTTGLEFAFREAAKEMKSLIISFWLLTVTLGNLLVAGITKFSAHGAGGEESVTSGRFFMYAGLSFVVAILFSAVAAFYQYRDPSAAHGK